MSRHNIDQVLSFRASQISLLFAVFAAVFVTCVAAHSQGVNNVHNFTGENSSAYPSNVIPAQGRDGALYGATGGQGGTNYGALYKLGTSGRFRQLYTFDKTTGAQPDSGVIFSSDGFFYGATFSGGSLNNGVLFRINSAGSLSVLHEFEGGVDGTAPTAPPVQGADGNLYGTTFGNATTASTIYKYSLSGGKFSTIYQFDKAQGTGIIAPLIQAADGNLYGTAFQGGANNCGTLFKISTSGSLLWFYSFPCGKVGANPVGPLVQATDGILYGTTSQGGEQGIGTVFRLDPTGAVSILYSFQGFSGGADDGSTPNAGLVQATDGHLYGSTSAGGKSNLGTLFQVTPEGTYKLLYSFTTGTDSGPSGSLVQHSNGLLYGTALQGGEFGFGTVYSLNMSLAPFIALVRYQGKIGATAQILGQGLTGTTSVTFNGIVATNFKVVSDTYMTAVVPSGAKTGPLVVTTPSAKLTSNKNFRVIGTTASGAKSRIVGARKAAR